MSHFPNTILMDSYNLKWLFKYFTISLLFLHHCFNIEASTFSKKYPTLHEKIKNIESCLKNEYISLKNKYDYYE